MKCFHTQKFLQRLRYQNNISQHKSKLVLLKSEKVIYMPVAFAPMFGDKGTRRWMKKVEIASGCNIILACTSLKLAVF